jgi:hypothetical protein
VDYYTGYEIQVFALYYIPLFIFSRYSGTFGAVLISLLTASVWVYIDIFSGHLYSSFYILIWNTLIRLASFLIISFGSQHIYRLLRKETELAEKLKTAIGEIKQLSGLLPICSGCKKIRNDKGYWEDLEDYIGKKTDAAFTHGLCPECMEKFYPEYFKQKEE